MIKSFKSKGLKELFVKGNTSKLPHERIRKIQKIMGILHSTHELRDLNIPAFRLHKLKAPPYKGFWSIDITGNYRLIFRFEGGHIFDLDYLDTH